MDANQSAVPVTPVTTVGNPFAMSQSRPDLPIMAVSSAANADAQREIAIVQAQMILARTNPRDPVRCMDNILQDCQRLSLAESAAYEYARGGTTITGPSIRLAEAIARRWGNISTGIKEVRHQGFSEVRVEAIDLETGYYDFIQFHVEHVRDTRQGRKILTDERDIYETVANQGQRRKRSVLKRVIPDDVFDAAMAQCDATLKAQADTSIEGVARLLAAFQTFGVTREHIEKRIQRRLDAISAAQVVNLRRIYTSLRDEVSKPQDWFEMEAGALDHVRQAVQAKKETSKAAAKGKAVAPTDEQSNASRINTQAVIERIRACREPEFLDLIGQELQSLTDGHDKDVLLEAFFKRREELMPPSNEAYKTGQDVLENSLPIKDLPNDDLPEVLDDDVPY